MTSTIIESDVESIEHLDFDEAVPCDNKGSECSGEAEMVVKTACCNAKFLICENCYFSLMAVSNRIMKQFGYGYCGHCGAVVKEYNIKFVRWLDRGR